MSGNFKSIGDNHIDPDTVVGYTQRGNDTIVRTTGGDFFIEGKTVDQVDAILFPPA